MKGRDIDLVRHAEPPNQRTEPSAFAGTVPFPIFPGFDVGAALWADEDGWVYRISDWPGYDINSLLEGKVSNGRSGYRDVLMKGEQEIAIPARVPLKHIDKIGRVKKTARGLLRVDWSEK